MKSKLTITLTPEVKRQIRILAAMNEQSISQYIEGLCLAAIDKTPTSTPS